MMRRHVHEAQRVISRERGKSVHIEPVAIDGEKYGAVDMLTKLNYLGGEHGIGRVDLVENRFQESRSWSGGSKRAGADPGSLIRLEPIQEPGSVPAKPQARSAL